MNIACLDSLESKHIYVGPKKFNSIYVNTHQNLILFTWGQQKFHPIYMGTSKNPSNLYENQNFA